MTGMALLPSRLYQFLIGRTRAVIVSGFLKLFVHGSIFIERKQVIQ
jgi:hypothetical protein